MLRLSALLSTVLLSAACSKFEPGSAAPTDAAPREVTVFAATSLRDALQEVAPDFESTHGAKVVFAFGSSGDLSKQIVTVDRADVFLSADEKEMDRVATAARIEVGTRRDLFANRLVVIEPVDGASGAFAREFSAAQLGDARITRWSLANVETVPAGRYAKAWLEAVGAYESIRERVVPAVDVRAALAAVESGACTAGIVYATDAVRSKRVRVVHSVPAADGPVIRYPGAVVTNGSAHDLGLAFLQFLTTSEVSAVFERHGFAVLRSAN